MIPRFPFRNELTRVERRIFFVLLILFFTGLTACAPSTATPQSITPAATAYPWTDANAVMSGLCFEAVYDAAGRTFVIHNADELSQLYDLADHSQLCRHPVQRASFDFSGGNILVGLWSRAVGCNAHHDLISVRRDDAARTYAINLRLVVEGICNYELVRPFWVGLSGVSDYDVSLRVQ